MRVMVMLRTTTTSGAGSMPTAQRRAELREFNDRLNKAGVLLAAGALQPSSRGQRVRCSGATRIVVDGPFLETNELLAGYWIWQVKSIHEAVEWVKRGPDPWPGEEIVVEIRPLLTAADFAD